MGFPVFRNVISYTISVEIFSFNDFYFDSWLASLQNDSNWSKNTWK